MEFQYKLILLAVVLAAVTTVRALPVETHRKLRQVIPGERTRVILNNILEGKENMEVHCQGSSEDFVTQEVANGGHYTLEFWPVGIADYYCTFLFNQIQHRFDVYLTLRDGSCGSERICTWDIKEIGPCRHDANFVKDQCYPWDQN